MVRRPRLKGIRTTRKKMANGTIRTYFYERYTNTRLSGKPGSPEFIQSYDEARKHRAQTGSFAHLLTQFCEAPEFIKLAPRTRRDYRAYIQSICEEFGNLPLEALDDHRIRQDFKRWRDTMAQTPRKADLAWSVLRRVLSWAKDQTIISQNHATGGGRLHSGNRADIIWDEQSIAKAMKHFPKHILDALILALHTGQRRGDLLSLSWANYEDGRIILRQQKTGRRVAVPTTTLLRNRLEKMPRTATTILTTSRGTPWTGDGFGSSWDKAKKDAGIEGLTFHDLRGTAITRLHLAGCKEAEIASISGHKVSQITRILDSYLAVSSHLADSAIVKLERYIS